MEIQNEVFAKGGSGMSGQEGHDSMDEATGSVLVIDTSFGSTVGVLGREPRVETDSRSHVEHLQVNVAAVMADAGLAPADLDTVVVGLGPAPFTGLRAGIVTAKALAYATGAKLLGQDILLPQARFAYKRALAAYGETTSRQARMGEGVRILTLAVNDARRHQLYFQLFDDFGEEFDSVRSLAPMDIDYPDAIAERVSGIVDDRKAAGQEVQVVISGHGARRYEDNWRARLPEALVSGESFLDSGAPGLALMVDCARSRDSTNPGRDLVEPLYLRRPDVSVPNPLKHVVKS